MGLGHKPRVNCTALNETRIPVLSNPTYMGTSKNLEPGSGGMRSCCRTEEPLWWQQQTVVHRAARDRVAHGQWQSQAVKGPRNIKHHPVTFEKTLLHMHGFSILVLPCTFQSSAQITLT